MHTKAILKIRQTFPAYGLKKIETRRQSRLLLHWAIMGQFLRNQLTVGQCKVAPTVHKAGSDYV